VWTYRDQDGWPLFLVARYETGDVGKAIRPWCFDRAARRWISKAPPAPRPLYGLDRLAERPEALVLIVEGEKTADAAGELFPGYVAVTSSGGSSAAQKTDWRPLEGRRVVIWPDADDPGRTYAESVAQAAREAGASDVRVVRVPGDFPASWDVADDPPEGWTVEQLRELVETAPQITAEDSPSGHGILCDLWKPVGLAFLTTPPPARRWLLRRSDGKGLLPRGRAGVLAGEGGAGKTLSLLYLAVSVIAGRPWFGCFPPDDDAVGERAALLLGEEELEEVHRRLWTIATALQLSEAERELIADRLTVVPLAGCPVGLLETTARGEVLETQFYRDLVELLGSGGPWGFVGIDPFSRFAQEGAEADNYHATRFLQAVETLTGAPGGPTVLVAAHSSKLSRRLGSADVRGVSGITDAARWVGTLLAEKNGAVVFEQAKSNYSLKLDPVRLVWRDHLLVAQTEEDLDAEKSAEQAAVAEALDADVRAVVDALRREGPLGSKDAVARAAGLRAARGRTALDVAISRGLAVRTGNSRRTVYSAADSTEVCVTHPPYTPRDGGTASCRLTRDPVSPVRDGDGTAWDGGTAKGMEKLGEPKSWPAEARYAAAELERSGTDRTTAQSQVRSAWEAGVRGSAEAIAAAAREIGRAGREKAIRGLPREEG